MKKCFFLVITIFLLFSPVVANAEKIPDWMKDVFLWYGQGKISETEVLNALQWLINNNILRIEKSDNLKEKIYASDNLEDLFPTREQIGTPPIIHPSQMEIFQIVGQNIQALSKYYTIQSDHDLVIRITQFNSNEEAMQNFQNHKEYSQQRGGFKYFDVTIKEGQCYGEDPVADIRYDVYCLKENTFYKVASKNIVNARAYANFVSDNFERD